MTIYTSSFAPITSWAEENLYDFLFTNNPNQVDSNPALIDAYSEEIVTYGELKARSLRFAHGLSKLGIKTSIIIFSPNSTVYPILLFGGAAAGVTVSTANPGYTPEEFSHSLSLSGAEIQFVYSDPALIKTALEACKIAGIAPNIYLLPGADGKMEKGFKSWEELQGEVNSGFEAVKFTEEELKNKIAFLPFSSGTTGKGKGVCLSHSNVTAIGQQIGNIPDIFDRPFRCMGTLPLYHIFGLIVVLHANIKRGGTIILMPKFELPKFCESVQKYRATSAFIVPPIALGLAKHPMVNDYDLSSLSYMISGAAPLSYNLAESLKAKLNGKTSIIQGYGMTETTSVALLPALDGGLPGSCGRLIASMEARLVDADSGKDVAIGSSGELWLRGPNIMMRYHQNEKATNETITQDGWLMTGDVCIRSEDGDYTIVDRTKELIKYSGFQVPPAELEALLLDSPMVADCAVIGVWDEERATELPRAYVVPEAAYAADPLLPQKIEQFVAERVASHKKLRGGVHIIDIIPKSPSGKILRKDLRVLAAKEKSEKQGAKL